MVSADETVTLATLDLEDYITSVFTMRIVATGRHLWLSSLFRNCVYENQSISK